MKIGCGNLRNLFTTHATFNDAVIAFIFKSNPFTDEPINKGLIRLAKKNVGEKHNGNEITSNVNLYRVGHPLAQKLITKCKTEELNIQELIFDYSGSDKKISIVEELIGKQGWLQSKQITISSFEEEDYILFAAIDDSGHELLPEQCQRLFSLNANYNSNSYNISQLKLKRSGKISFTSIKSDILNKIEKETATFLNDEVDKLGKTGVKMIRNSIKFEIYKNLTKK